MKKTKLTLALAITFILFLALTTLACRQDTFFYQIEQETELEEEVLSGAVTSVVKFGDELYACDGGIYSKPITKLRGWEHASAPKGFIVKLAASDTALYALNSDNQIFMKTATEDWKILSSLTFEGSIKTIFCDGNGNAYLHTIKTVDNETVSVFYEFTGASISVSTAVPSSVVTLNGNIMYYANGSTVVSVDTTNETNTVPYDAGKTVYSISFSSKDKALYVGTSEGLKKLPVDETNLLTGTASSLPGSNHESTIKDSYTFLSVLATEDALYCSTICEGSYYTMINGLWGYYYDRRDSWNVE